MDEGSNFHGNFDNVGWGSVLLDGDSAGCKSRLDVRVFAILAIVRRNSDALERALIYTVDEDTLKELVMRPDKLSSE